VNVEEPPTSITGVATSITAFVGTAPRGAVNTPVTVTSYDEYERAFGGLWLGSSLGFAVRDYFLNGGGTAIVVRVVGVDLGKRASGEGLWALEKVESFDLLVIPSFASAPVDLSVMNEVASYCQERRAIFVADAPVGPTGDISSAAPVEIGTAGGNVALYYPRLRLSNPLNGGAVEAFAAAGAVAGVIARTDRERGVWTTPAGVHATLVGAPELTETLTSADVERLAAGGVNCLRDIPGAGPVIWGARTLQGGESRVSEWKYLSVRRTSLFIEKSLYGGTGWAVFEPNTELLWARLRKMTGAFMDDLFQQGAFAGFTSQQAYFVRCDSETTTQADVDLGIVNITVGFAPIKPAEFVILQIRQKASG